MSIPLSPNTTPCPSLRAVKNGQYHYAPTIKPPQPVIQMPMLCKTLESLQNILIKKKVNQSILASKKIDMIAVQRRASEHHAVRMEGRRRDGR